MKNSIEKASVLAWYQNNKITADRIINYLEFLQPESSPMEIKKELRCRNSLILNVAGTGIEPVTS